MNTVFQSLSDARAHAAHCQVLSLDLGKNPRIDASITELINLRQLTLQGDGEVALPEELGTMASLTSVVLQNSSMGALPAFIFSLPNLERLELGWLTDLEDIDERAHQLQALRTLHLSNPSAAFLQKVHHFSHVEEVRLSGVRGPDIDLSGFAQLKSLRRLSFDSPRVPESINELGHLEDLNVDAYGAVELPKKLDGLKALKRLRIGGTVARFPSQVLKLEGLEELTLVGAKQKPLKLPAKGWKKLKALRVLRILPTIEALPDEVAELSALEEIQIDLPKVEELPVAIFACTALRRLQLSVDFLAKINVSQAPFSKLPQLEHVDLRVPSARAFPQELCSLHGLRELRLTSNRFKEIPDSIGELQNLESLELTLDYDASAFPQGILALRNLRKLDFSGACKEPMPAEIGQLQELEELAINKWQFQTVPEEFGQLKKLHTLRLNGCALTELPPFIGGLTALKTLDLSYNEFRSLPASIGELPGLENLNLSSTALAALPAEVGNLQALSTLSVNNTHLSALPDALFRLEKLAQVFASRCQLSALPESIAQAKSLTELSLSHNRISSLPKALTENERLKRLDLSGNEFTAAAMAALSKLQERLGYSFQPPIVRKSIPIPETVSSAPLASAVAEQLQRLGAALKPATPPAAVQTRTFPFGSYPVPEAIRQLLEDVEWPPNTYKGSSGWCDLWMVQFGVGWSHDEYQCVYHHPYVGFALMDGGNYSFLLRLDDASPSDPVVYRIDHEDYSVEQASQLSPSMSEFLKGLQRE